jgi:tetratricopeptide (TPR) repeat protein
LEEAEVVLVRHLERYPDADQAREELQWLYFNQFRGRELEQLLEAALSRPPVRYATLVHMLLSEFRPPVPREGIGYLEKTHRRRPGQAPVALALGYCDWQLGEIDKARQFLEVAWAKNPHDPHTRLVTAEFLLEQNDLAAARKVLDQPAQQDDRWWWINSRLAEIEGNDAAALESLDQALAVRPFELRYVHRRAILLQALGRQAEAAESFQQANRLEAVQTKLTEIVLSGQLERPTVALCDDVARLCDERGRSAQAAGWREVTERLKRTGTTEPSARAGGRFPSPAERVP